MKKLLILSLLAASASTTLADYNGTGYYRVQNYKTTRWISIIDNKGSMDVGSTTFDLGAVQLQKNWDEVCCDPASILYIYPHSGKYQIEAQGTGINQISNRYIDISEAGTGADGKLYYAYGTENGMLKYIGDGELIKKKDKTIAVTNATGDYRKWYIKPVTGDGSCYLGVKTTVNAGGKHYATMYASFPMKPYSDGVKAYVVNTVDQGMAVLDEVTDVIGANTPVVFECATDSPNTNRLTVGGKVQPTPQTVCVVSISTIQSILTSTGWPTIQTQCAYSAPAPTDLWDSSQPRDSIIFPPTQLIFL